MCNWFSGNVCDVDKKNADYYKFIYISNDELNLNCWLMYCFFRIVKI